MSKPPYGKGTASTCDGCSVLLDFVRLVLSWMASRARAARTSPAPSLFTYRLSAITRFEQACKANLPHAEPQTLRKRRSRLATGPTAGKIFPEPTTDGV